MVASSEERRVRSGEIVELRLDSIVYVSYDPSTLGRDAVVLAGGGYKLVEVQPVDMFPQTYHIETISLWQRRGAAG
ncbi:MAG: tRNA (uracil-5-)-methyltransferase [Anaerolineae bacterium]|nr:tRNA (uracil-5-)-methyltransferase [Anaerolineae bacterium]